MLTMVPRQKLDQALDDLRVLQQTCDGLSVDLDAAKHEMSKMSTSHHQHLEAMSKQLDSSRIEITRFGFHLPWLDLNPKP
jgi:flagellar basal body rod protein FlgB